MRIAAIDIGSNSLHLLIVRVDSPGQFHVLHKEKKMVRLGAWSLHSEKIPSVAAERALRALKRFASRCQKFEVGDIAPVATSAVREASNRDSFLRRVADGTGLTVRVLSGADEGRLIALAVSRFNRRFDRSDNLKDLILDIGGGSTELILTNNGGPVRIESLELGAVRLTERFLETDPPARADVARLRKHTRRLLDGSLSQITAQEFARAVGTSGTIRALARMSLWTDRSPGDLRRPRLILKLKALQELNQHLCETTLQERSRIPGLPGRRADIIVAGGLLLEEIMTGLSIDRLITCPWALREGVLFDLLQERRSVDTRKSAKPINERVPVPA